MGPYQFEMLNKEITDFEWSIDFQIFIKKNNFKYLGDILKLTINELLLHRDFNYKLLKEYIAVIGKPLK